jgi:hypothetical protein
MTSKSERASHSPYEPKRPKPRKTGHDGCEKRARENLRPIRTPVLFHSTETRTLGEMSRSSKPRREVQWADVCDLPRSFDSLVLVLLFSPFDQSCFAGASLLRIGTQGDRRVLRGHFPHHQSISSSIPRACRRPKYPSPSLPTPLHPTICLWTCCRIDFLPPGWICYRHETNPIGECGTP